MTDRRFARFFITMGKGGFMTREVKKPEIRKSEILSTAQQLFFQKGFEKTSIQDIIAALGIAKGTFYHYFTSKMDLLDELMDSITNNMLTVLKPILESKASAIEKFNKMFREGTGFKVANIEVFMVMLKVMFKDENTVLRTKIYRTSVEKNIPLYTKLIKQGIKEGVFDTKYPEDTAELLLQLGTNLNETVCRLILREDETPQQLSEIIRNKIILYQHAMERILNAPEDSIKVIEDHELNRMIELFRQRPRQNNSDMKSKLHQRAY
jgi:AcrR family transcriptional regulator